ncbi:MAG: Hsp20 family protein, partial [Pirellulaceae bacterium]|nr:Hsp20 family protein [Pirellulaceae bacterium]
FVESFTLPNGVREDDIVARYRNGILEVDLPKSEEVQGKRIEVKSN